MTIAATARLLVAKAGGRPVSEFLLIPFGRVGVDRAAAGGPFEFTREMAAAAISAFDAAGRQLVIDYEHQSMGGKYNTRPDQLAPAAGWVNRLEARADGLWAAGVEWADRARELIARGEYAYFSPVIYWNSDRTQLTGLGPVALTNDPAMRGVPRLAATQERDLMNATILAARRVPTESQQGGFGASGTETADDAAGVLAAFEAFASAIHIEMLNAAVSEELIAGLAEIYSDEDERAVLWWIAEVVDGLSSGETPRQIAGRLLQNSPSVNCRRADPAGRTVTMLTPARERAWRAEYRASASLRSEFRQEEAYVAYKRAAAGGLVATSGRPGGFAGATAPPSRAITGAEGESAWRSSFRTNPELQAEFGDAGDYVAYKRAEAAGLVSISRPAADSATAQPAAAPAGSGVSEQTLRALYSTSAELRREFGDFETFAAYAKHSREGHVTIYERR